MSLLLQVLPTMLQANKNMELVIMIKNTTNQAQTITNNVPMALLHLRKTTEIIPIHQEEIPSTTTAHTTPK